MDPNETLARIRANVATLLEQDDEHTAAELAQDVAALDEWLTHGGFAPTAWKISPHDWQ